MARVEKERLFHLFLALAIVACVFWGFTYTYLGERFTGGTAPALPVAVHVHGLSFLAWYALLGLQALLVIVPSMKPHRSIGYCTIPLAVLMILTGLLVIGARMEKGLYHDDPFWASFSLAIFSNLILFAVFYTLAILRRSRPDQHRRLIIVAAAVGSGAAIFRVFMTLIGPGFYAVPAGILVTNLFLVIGAVGDKIILGKPHRVYLLSLPLALILEVGLLAFAFTDMGVEFQREMVGLMKPFLWLY